MPGGKRGPCSRLLQGELPYSPTERALSTTWSLSRLGILDVNLGAEDRISESVPRDRCDLPVRAW
jgi:hypothetical protein